MFGARIRELLLFAALGLSMLSAAKATTPGPSEIHREAVDEQSYPWSAIGKLFTEGGGECTGVLISRDKVLTAAHCLFNYRTGRFLTADALHFLVGYRTGRYAAHARIARYEIGAGFNPLRYEQTSDADWAVLTVTERLSVATEPLRLRRELVSSGTKVILAGYPQDRAFAMTADRDCELGDKIDAGRLFLHTCRGIKGTSGAPILVSAGGDEVQIAAIQIATLQSDGSQKMIAVPVQAIWHQGGDRAGDIVAEADSTPANERMVCGDDAGGEMDMAAIRARFELDPPDTGPDVVSSISGQHDMAIANALAWLALELEPFAIAIP
jgi:protease YdgD